MKTCSYCDVCVTVAQCMMPVDEDLYSLYSYIVVLITDE